MKLPRLTFAIALLIAGCSPVWNGATMPVPEPQMKAECAVVATNTRYRWIEFWSPVDKADTFARFGWMDTNQLVPEKWTLFVDGRYDMDEVAAYISACGAE